MAVFLLLSRRSGCVSTSSGGTPAPFTVSCGGFWTPRHARYAIGPVRPMDPPMVDELMCATWGRRYTQKDTADYIERSTQMPAKVGNPGSFVDDADKAEQPGTAQMSGEVAQPEELATPPEETRAGIEEHVRRLFGFRGENDGTSRTASRAHDLGNRTSRAVGNTAQRIPGGAPDRYEAITLDSRAAPPSFALLCCFPSER